MGDTKFSDVWRMMSQNEFKADSTSVNDELACFMCKKLMIDACQTACGCQYCYKCISEYVVDDSTYCPGGRQECNEEYLVLERDVMRNVRMNNKIYKLNVYCPNESCLSIMELSKMEEHLRLCSKKDTVCPCAALGCDKTSDNIRCDASSHTELLVGWITNLKNEIDGVKEKLSDCEIEIESLREESNTKDMQIAEIIDQKEYYKREMEIVKEESVEREKRMKSLEKELVDVKNEMKSEYSGMMNLINTCRKETKKCVEKFGAAKKDRGKGNRDRSVADLKMEDCGVGAQLDDVLNVVSVEPILNYDIGYTWRIDRISSKNKTTFSNEFYTKQYKLCLAVFFKDDVMSIWCYLMQGVNDDRLQWPMRHVVTLSVVNQRTLAASKSETFCYESYSYSYIDAFSRPLGRRNEFSIGRNAFLRFSTLADLASVVVNDSILVSCVLTHPDQVVISGC